jgi:hypothetical protein
MRTTANTQKIQVNVDFPNGIHGEPVVSNDTNQVDSISSSETGIVWHLKDGKGLDDDGLTLTGVDFFLDQAKTQPTTPSFFAMPGGHPTDKNRKWWEVEFNGTPVRELTTLYYTICYEDDDYKDLKWDPKIQIQPRGN